MECCQVFGGWAYRARVDARQRPWSLHESWRQEHGASWVRLEQSVWLPYHSHWRCDASQEIGCWLPKLRRWAWSNRRIIPSNFFWVRSDWIWIFAVETSALDLGNFWVDWAQVQVGEIQCNFQQKCVLHLGNSSETSSLWLIYSSWNDASSAGHAWYGVN